MPGGALEFNCEKPKEQMEDLGTVLIAVCRSGLSAVSSMQLKSFCVVWLNGLVLSALGIRIRGLRFDPGSGHCPLGKLFTHIASAVSQLQETGVQNGSFRRLSGYGD